MLSPPSPSSSPAVAVTRKPPRPRDPHLRRFSHGAAVAAVLAILPIIAVASALAFNALGVDIKDHQLSAVLGITAFGAFCGVILSIAAMVSINRAPHDSRPYGLWLAALSLPISLLTSLIGALGALIAGSDFSRGRQLRERGKARFAELVENDAWQLADAIVDGDVDVRGVDAPVEVAHAWRENGKTEHASVGAFARLAGELVALGAPSQLVEDAHKDALDEIRHARLCFSLARAIDGQPLSPGPLPAAVGGRGVVGMTKATTLAALAVESLLDGALNEGTSARTVAKLARRVDDEQVRAVLLAIARDEGRHAAHGWSVLEWCLREGGAPTASAVRAALRALPMQLGKSLVVDGDDGRWERYGIPGRALTEQAYAEVRASVQRRALALLADDDGPRAAA